MRGELFISGRRAIFIGHETMSTDSTPWDLSPLVSRARIRQEYVPSRQRINYRESRASRPRRKKMKEEEESDGAKREAASLLETLVERCLTGTCCWWHTNEYLPLLSTMCTLARPRCSSRPVSLSLVPYRALSTVISTERRRLSFQPSFHSTLQQPTFSLPPIWCLLLLSHTLRTRQRIRFCGTSSKDS